MAGRGYKKEQVSIPEHPLRYFLAGSLEAGCDEAGRGPMAGPVFAAAVVLPPTDAAQDTLFHPLLNDSKKMSLKARQEVRSFIMENALAWAVTWLSPEAIDVLNILHASIKAMQMSVDVIMGKGVDEVLKPIREMERLVSAKRYGNKGEDFSAIPMINGMGKSGIISGGSHVTPQIVLVDGNRFSSYSVEYKCFVKGDARFAAISAASVLAKCFRDEYMAAAHEFYPQYGWNSNMGYPTKAHREAIANFGRSPLHRLSFRFEDEEPTLF